MFTAGSISITPPPPPILKPSIVMTAPRCLPRFPVPPAASDGSVGAADEVPPLGPSEVGTISQHDANIRVLPDLPAILAAVANRGSGGNKRQRAIPRYQNGQRGTEGSSLSKLPGHCYALKKHLLTFFLAFPLHQVVVGVGMVDAKDAIDGVGGCVSQVALVKTAM